MEKSTYQTAIKVICETIKNKPVGVINEIGD